MVTVDVQASSMSTTGCHTQTVLATPSTSYTAYSHARVAGRSVARAPANTAPACGRASSQLCGAVAQTCRSPSTSPCCCSSRCSSPLGQLGSSRLHAHGSQHRHVDRLRVRPSAGAMDSMPAWTLDQIAGLLFGAIMLASVLGARQIDVLVARQQRRQLGLCEFCGGVYEPSVCATQGCPSRTGVQPQQPQPQPQQQVPLQQAPAQKARLQQEQQPQPEQLQANKEQ